MNTLKLNSAGLNRVTLNTIGEVRLVSKPPIPTYTLSASVVNGVVSATLNGVAVPLPYTAKEGDVIVVSVTPTDGYTFEGWSDGNTDNPRTITMSEDVDLSAECVEDVPSYENGVYIQHIDGKLYTTDEWTAKAFANDEANGVAVKEEKSSFVIAKQDIGTATWGTSKLVSGVTVVDTSNGATAKVKDYVGEDNTSVLVSAGTFPAAQNCAAYTFPNGAKGYLAAIGEWNIAISTYKTEIDTAFNAIDGVNPSGFYWSSTQRNANNAWRIKWDDGGTTYNESKGMSYNVRAFTKLK